MNPLIFVLATFPHTGNNWIRNMFELSTGIGTEAVYPEYGKWSNRSHSFGHSCGNDGGRRHRRKHGHQICKLIHRPEPYEPVIVKTHWPTFSISPEQVESFDEGIEGIILTVRNPDDWCKRYLVSDFKHPYKTMDECIPGMEKRFKKHNDWWLKRYPYLPTRIYNYTLMDRDPDYTQDCMDDLYELTGTTPIRNAFEYYPGKNW